jgi:hypothetical protein
MAVPMTAQQQAGLAQQAQAAQKPIARTPVPVQRPVTPQLSGVGAYTGAGAGSTAPGTMPAGASGGNGLTGLPQSGGAVGHAVPVNSGVGVSQGAAAPVIQPGTTGVNAGELGPSWQQMFGA